MFDHLPDFIDPFECVERKRRLKGAIPLDRMDRILDGLLNRAGEANVELEFRREGRIAAIVGRVDAELGLQCQCCLEVLNWPVHSEVRLGVVRSLDEAALLPEPFEALVVESGAAIAVKDIVQDELLLAIPPIPQHSECGVPKAEIPAEGTPHPFAALAQLRQTNT